MLLSPVGVFDDERRLDELVSLELLDTEPEPEFDHIVKLVAETTGCPVSLISLVDRDRQWFKARFGLDVTETPRTNSFCDTAIRQGETFVVRDTLLDDRFKHNPLVVNAPNIRFYAAQPLLTSTGFRIGTLCAIDQRPRELSAQQLEHLALLAQQTIRLMELRLANRRLSAVRRELEQARDQAENANRAKTFFLANMSHEIRTPLGAILGYTDLLRDERLSDADRGQFIDTIKRNGKALTRLIDDILDLAKVESGKLKIEKIEFSLEALCREVLGLFEKQAAEKGISLRCTISNQVPPQLISDPTRLRQILFNLVGNSVKFTPAGRVEIRVLDPVETKNGLKFEILVSDTGIGIEPHESKRLFQPFSQADSSTSRRFGGTGLGLALSRRLAQSLGGNLELAESRAGAGSTFRLEIRAQAARASAGEPQREESLEAFNFGGSKFLVVDDSQDNLFLAKRLLEKQGASVEVARNGREAVERGLKCDFDLVLMDIQMPEMDGFEATRELRARGFAKPIIAVTAHAMNDDQVKTRAAGCNAHISKPLETARMFAEISRHL